MPLIVLVLRLQYWEHKPDGGRCLFKSRHNDRTQAAQKLLVTFGTSLTNIRFW